MSIFHYFEILIFGKRAAGIKKLRREKHNKLDDLIFQFERERMLLQAEHFSEANDEKEGSKSETDAGSA